MTSSWTDGVKSPAGDGNSFVEVCNAAMFFVCLLVPRSNQFCLSKLIFFSVLGGVCLRSVFEFFFYCMSPSSRKWSPPFQRGSSLSAPDKVQLNEDAQFLLWLNPRLRFINALEECFFLGHDWLITFFVVVFFALSFSFARLHKTRFTFIELQLHLQRTIWITSERNAAPGLPLLRCGPARSAETLAQHYWDWRAPHEF